MWLMGGDCCGDGDEEEEGKTLNGEIEDVICFPLMPDNWGYVRTYYDLKLVDARVSDGS